MKTFILNGNIYPKKDIGYNMICDLEEQGISLETIEKKPMSMMRVYVASCMNTDKETAGIEIEKHLINGGKLEDISDILSEAMDESGFFRALGKTEETTPTSSKSKKKSEKVVAITEQ